MQNNGLADFEYRGWNVKIELEMVGDCFAGHADLHRDGSHHCRVALASSRLDQDSARWAIDSKARDFIDEWTTRPRTGTTRLQGM